MTLETNTTTETDQVCIWCREPLDLDSSVRRSVCADCFRLLINAGVKDEEIFFTEHQAEKEAAKNAGCLNLKD